MKKTQIKDALRNIWKQKVSFLSVLIIAAIGATTFLGIEYSASAMRANGSSIYNRYNFRDVEVISTLLFTEEDLDALRGIEGVTDAEPLRFTEAKLIHGEMREDLVVVTQTERINLPDVAEGRMPAEGTECALEKMIADKLGLRVGDAIMLLDAKDNKPEYLCSSEFTVVGIINHPDHINTVVPETPYAVVAWEAFDDAALEGCFMKAELVIDKPEKDSRFSSGYESAVDEVIEKIDALAETRAAARDNYVRGGWKDKLGENEGKLNEASTALEKARLEIEEKKEELEQGEQDIHDAEIELKVGKAALDDARVKLEAAKAQLDSAKKTLDSERGKLADGKKQLDSSKAQLDGAKAQLEDGYAMIESAKEQIRDIFRSAYERAFGSGGSLVRWAGVKKADVDDPAETARYIWITDGYRFDIGRSIEDIFGEIVNSEAVSDEFLVALYEVTQDADAPYIEGSGYDMPAIRGTIVSIAASAVPEYEMLSDGCNMWDKGHADYLAGLEEYKSGLAQYEDGKAQFDAGEAQYKSGLKEYESGLKQYLDQKNKYDKGVSEVSGGKAQIEEGREKLAEGEQEFNDGVNEYQSSNSKLDDVRNQIESVPPCRWIALSVMGNVSFAQLDVGSESISSIKMTFSLMFIIVGALVIFATVGKMVDEQRKLVGTTKALGFFSREIFAKYLLFGVSPTLIGAFLGSLAAHFGVEPFLLEGLNKYYIYDISESHISALPTALVFVACVVLATSAVWFACAKLLREPAMRLMQDKMPAGRKGRGGKRKLSLYSRLILLNMRSDLKRVGVTIVSVAGCCALIIVGITLRSAMKGCVDKQYGPITNYDLIVEFEPDYEEITQEKIGRVLYMEDTQFTDLYHTDATFKVDDMQSAELFCGEIDEINKLFRLDDWRSGKPLYATDEGVLIQRRMAETYDLDTGSEFDITIGGTKTVRVRVGGVFENYIGSPIVMSKGYYVTLFSEYCYSNAYLVRLGGIDRELLIDRLSNVDGFDTVKLADADRTIVETSTSMVDSAVILFIFIAAVLAGVVLMNLTNMNILHKKRELTVMRINGFTVKETKRYVLRETIVTTAIGIIVGIAFGAFITYRIIRKVEQVFLQFDRSPSVLAWGVAVVLTILFTVVVNTIALKKVKHLKLTDI